MNRQVNPAFAVGQNECTFAVAPCSSGKITDAIAQALGLPTDAEFASKSFHFGTTVIKSDDGIELARVDRADVSVTQVTNPNGTLRAWFTVDAGTTSLDWFTKKIRPTWRWSFRDANGSEMIAANIDSFEGNPNYEFEGFRVECRWHVFNTFAIHYLPTGPWYDKLKRLEYQISGTFYHCP